MLLFVTWTSEGYLDRLFLGDDGLLSRHDASGRGGSARSPSLEFAAWATSLSQLENAQPVASTKATDVDLIHAFEENQFE